VAWLSRKIIARVWEPFTHIFGEKEFPQSPMIDAIPAVFI
jgi:hypothetical protein